MDTFVKQHNVDAALMGLLGLLVVAAALDSATGDGPAAVLMLAVILSAAGIIVGSIFIVYRHHTRRRMLSAIVAPIAAVAVIISVAATHWPLRASYLLSRSSLEAVARRVRRGEPVAQPMRVGLFNIQRAELSDRGIVCLWTQWNLGGSTGFVQCRRDDVPFNLFAIVRLDHGWQFISED
jgi:hypothetical protein